MTVLKYLFLNVLLLDIQKGNYRRIMIQAHVAIFKLGTFWRF